MKRFSRLLRRACMPPLRLVPLIAAPCFLLMVYCVRAGRTDPLAHIAYLLATYALVLTVVGCLRAWRRLRRYWQRAPWLTVLRESPIFQLLSRDVVLRTKLALYWSTVFNLIIALVKLISGLRLGSIWLFTLGLYYLTLAFLRTVILRSDRRSPIGESPENDLRRYRLCGVILLVMNQVLLGVVALAVRQGSRFEYPGVLIYAVAAYAFFAITSATVKLTKYHRLANPLVSASKAVSFTAAMVSVFSLETALIGRFGEESVAFRRTMTSLLGGIICATELIVAIYMIAHANRELARLRDYY